VRATRTKVMDRMPLGSSLSTTLTRRSPSPTPFSTVYLNKGKSITFLFGTFNNPGSVNYTVVSTTPSGLTQCKVTITENGTTYNATSGTVSKTMVSNKNQFTFSNLPLNNGGGTASAGLLLQP
jgi:pectin methylesterase-like acyl-CoA thioesterase